MTSTTATSAKLKRCPACGQRIQSSGIARCSLCDFSFALDFATTSDDTTPFALSYARGESGWWRMLRWIWSAGQGRLKHIALMRASAASASFARMNLLLLAFGIGALEWTRTGWHNVYALSATAEAATKPAGAGWFHVASAVRPLPPGARQDTPTDLWWNAAQMLVAVPITVVIAFGCLLLAVSLSRRAAAGAHVRPIRGEQRMSAALHYATAWVVPIALAGFIAALRPIWYFADVARSGLPLPEELFRLGAGGLAALSAVLCWFWLIRLGATAPENSRGRVMALYALGFPTLVAACVAGWWYLDGFLAVIFRALGFMG